MTNDGVLLPEVKRHYMRIRPPEKGEAYWCESCGTETIHINNRPPGTRDTFEAREIIDGGFLELVRYGVRRADDPLMVDSLKVVDAVLKRNLPQGPGWLRYNWDGYGDTPDGGPFKGWGQGHVWPLLTGERAHYELAAGHDIAPLIADLRAVCHRRAHAAGAGVGCAGFSPAQPAAGRPCGLRVAAGLGARRVPEAAAFGEGWEGL